MIMSGMKITIMLAASTNSDVISVTRIDAL
jgi:hypothetical protein